MSYLLLKWLHVLSSTLLFGTGLGSAYYMLFASLTRDPRAVLVVARSVVIADWLFTATTAVIQPVTGMPLLTPWIAWSVGAKACRRLLSFSEFMTPPAPVRAEPSTGSGQGSLPESKPLFGDVSCPVVRALRYLRTNGCCDVSHIWERSIVCCPADI